MSEQGSIEIPDKTYFKIGEVAKLFDLEPYVLRYWEGEFDVLDPDKTDSNQRAYQRPDIELIDRIRDLLYNEMFTIAGARRQLELADQGRPCHANDHRREVHDQKIEKLERDNADLRNQVDELSAELDEFDVGDDQPDLWEERIAAQADQIERLKAKLLHAHQTVADLENQRNEHRAKLAKAAADPQKLRGLRHQVERLAQLSDTRR